MPVSPRARRSLPIAMDDENTCLGQRLARATPGLLVLVVHLERLADDRDRACIHDRAGVSVFATPRSLATSAGSVMSKVDRGGGARRSLELVSEDGLEARPPCRLRDAAPDGVPPPAADRAPGLRGAVDGDR